MKNEGFGQIVKKFVADEASLPIPEASISAAAKAGVVAGGVLLSSISPTEG
jgi:hypothetical protein